MTQQKQDWREKKFLLVDYKGKCDIICDKGWEDELDIVVGEITKDVAFKELKERVKESIYYGIPAYIGNDQDLKQEIMAIEEDYSLLHEDSSMC